MADIERTLMLFDVLDDTDSTDVVTVLDVTDVTGFQVRESFNLVVGEVVLEGITDLDFRVGESDGSGVVGNDVGDLVGTNSLSGDLQEFVLSFFLVEGLEDESTLGVVEDSEGLVGLFDSDDVHKTSGETLVSSDLVVNQDVLFLIVEDEGNISTVQGVVKSFLEQDGERETFSKLVRTLRRSGSPSTTQLVKHPRLGSVDSL